METVSLETTVVGSIAGRIHPNPDVASRQRKSRRWWATDRHSHRLLISHLVLDECQAGDPTAAKERLHAIGGLHRPDMMEGPTNLGKSLLAGMAIPGSDTGGSLP